MTRRRARLTVAVALAATIVPAAAPAPAQAAGCITRLPVRVTLPSFFAASYVRSIPVTVTTMGPPIRFLRVGLYTFGGARIAEGVARTTLRGTTRLFMPLRFGPMQAGRFTLVATGEPNLSRSCGPKKYIRVQSFRDCINTLPVVFPRLPGGVAADYGEYLSVPVQAAGPLIRGMEMNVYSFAGELYGSGRMSVLFGASTMHMRLTRPLDPGSYTIIMEGTIAQPLSCGPKTVQRFLHFG